MFRKPGFWVVFLFVTAACVLFSVANFPRAFPIVTLDFEMDRETALQAARDLDKRFQWGPEEFRQAASFDLDSRVQSFVELEGGGKEAFTRMLSEGLYWPYRWTVRNFAEFETNETLVRFSPAGQPIGFVETIAEEDEGPALEPDVARTLAERAAIRDWGVDLDQYGLVEEADEVRPSGRIDHTFVYERRQPTLGSEGRYRLRLVMSGDRFTELSHFVKVPESFSRRYEEMRSANNGIAAGASIAAAILYVIGGCMIGLFLLLRKRWVLWKQAVMWGLFIAFLQALVFINQWPLLWMGYDTAISATNFALQQLVQAVLVFVGMGILLTVSFMAAESLTRRAFPNHVQLWRSWDADVAGTSTVAGMTGAGYLLVGVFFAYDVALYLFANNALGWWSPSSAMFDPNVLATYLPWLSSVAISLQAGFWEECLFRAIPLASAALIGERFGGKKWWILGALVLQAIIFGAGHANYPAQPAYARLVELIIPAIGFGVLYLVFGLLPAIVLHFTFDVVWFALPLFAASTQGIWVDRALVIALTLIPVWFVLNGRRKIGEWSAVDDTARNEAWQPPAGPIADGPSADVRSSAGLSTKTATGLAVAGVMGLVMWVAVDDRGSDAPTLDVDRGQAVATARTEIDARSVTIPEDWQELSNVVGRPGLEDRFVWQEGGPAAYDTLMGTFIAPPMWMVRYVSFEGDVVERAEEYRVWVSHQGEVSRFTHDLPESRVGDALSEVVARKYAVSTIGDWFGDDPASLREVSAEPERHPDRVDWTFVFADDSSYPVADGEARIMVRIAGNEVADVKRFVHVPEEWEREQRNLQSRVQLVQIVCVVAMILIFIAGTVVAVIRWSKGRFASRTFSVAAVVLIVLGGVGLINGWPALTAGFSSAQPYQLQTAIVMASMLLVLVASATGIAMSVGLVHRWIPRQPSGPTGLQLAGAGGLGLALSGLGVLLSLVAPRLEPLWPSFDAAGARWPFLAAALDPISGWVAGTALAMLVITFVDTVSSGRGRWRNLLFVALVAAGFVVAGVADVPSISRWITAGTLTGAALIASYLFVFRFQMALLPVTAAAMGSLATLREGLFRAYPGALFGSILGAVAIIVAGILWSRAMTRDADVIQGRSR